MCKNVLVKVILTKNTLSILKILRFFATQFFNCFCHLLKSIIVVHIIICVIKQIAFRKPSITAIGFLPNATTKFLCNEMYFHIEFFRKQIEHLALVAPSSLSLQTKIC